MGSAFGATPVVGRCPCGSGRMYAACCGPLHTGERLAGTAVELMRSRYAAYAVGDVAHLARTWHPRTRPMPLDVDPALRWDRLEVLDVVAGGVDDSVGEVEFAAHWSSGSGRERQQGVLRERSAFERRARRWVYVAALT